MPRINVLLEGIGPRHDQPVRITLGQLHLKRIVPGVAERRSQEGRNTDPLRMRAAEPGSEVHTTGNPGYTLFGFASAGNAAITAGLLIGWVSKRQLCRVVDVDSRGVPVLPLGQQPGRGKSILGFGVQVRRCKPCAAVAYVGGFNQQAGDDFALQPDAPLENARRPSRALVDRNERRIDRFARSRESRGRAATRTGSL